MSAMRLAAVLLLVGGCDGTRGVLVDLGDEGTSLGEGGSPAADAGTDSAVPSTDQTFQVQLTGTLDLEMDADVFVLDLHTPSDEELATLQALAREIVCYFSAGSWEPWRPDAESFPSTSLGDALDDYPSERWLDVNDATVRSLMAARITTARSRGCDAVYPGLMELPLEPTGFASDAADYRAFVAELGRTADNENLAFFYGGGAPAIDTNVQYLDAGIGFGCIAAGTCDRWLPFAEQGKRVFLVETGSASEANQICAQERPAEFPVIVKPSDLSAERHACP